MASLVALAEEIATHAHAGQFRRDGVTPYIEHPRAVAKRLAGEPEGVIAVGWLHDVLEENELISVQRLKYAGLSDVVVGAVVLLTHITGTKYENYLERLSHNWICVKVKIADIRCNLDDDPTPRQIEKYTKALKFLGAEIDQDAAGALASPLEIRKRCGWTENQYIEILHDFIDLSFASAELTHYLKQEAHKQGFKY